MRNIFIVLLVAFGIGSAFAAKEMKQVQMVSLADMANVLNVNNSTPIDASLYDQGSIHFIWTGSPNGTLAVQVSDDIVSSFSTTAAASTLVSNWVTIPSASLAVSSLGSGYVYTFNPGMAYKWLRVFYSTGTVSASGSLSATFFGSYNE